MGLCQLRASEYVWLKGASTDREETCHISTDLGILQHGRSREQSETPSSRENQMLSMDSKFISTLIN